IKSAWWAQPSSGPLALALSCARHQRRVVFGKRALGRAVLVGKAEPLAQGVAALSHRPQFALLHAAFAVEGAEESVLAADEGLAALACQADPLKVVGHRVLPRQSEEVELLLAEHPQLAIGYRHHQVGDGVGHAIALQVLADLAMDLLQLLLQLGAG